ncbi:hypothetical protein ACQ4PT_051073 [Festuca glaucescens]
MVASELEAPVAAGGASPAAAMCKRSNRLARVLAYAFLEWILIALLLANGVFSCLIAKFAAFCGLPPPCALCSRLGVDSLFSNSSRRRGGAEPLRRVVCDAHAAVMSRLGYCRAHRRLADAADMCEDCGAAASGKELLSWMRRSELGERDLACACCGVALESGFYSPPFLLPTPAERDLDCGYKEDGTACRHGDVVFVSEDGPVIELFDEKPLVHDGDSVGVMPAHCAGIVANAECLVPLESTDSLAGGVAAVSSQSSAEGKEALDNGTVERENEVNANVVNANENEVTANEEKSVVASDDDHKVDDMVDRSIDGEITALGVSVASMENDLNCETNAGEIAESLAHHHSPQGNNRLEDKYQDIAIADEISEDGDQVEQGAVKHELFSMPSDTREHGFVLDKSGGNTETVPVQQADIKNEWDAMPLECGSFDSEASNENTEVKHVDEEFEEEIIAQAKSPQELDSVVLNSWEQVTETSGKDDIEVDPTEAFLPSLHQLSDGHSISSDKSSPDCSDVEDKRVPDTPTDVEGISYLQELPDPPKAVISVTKTVDSSVATMSTDLESVELVTIDQLKSALAGAHKSLSTLYAELENERNAAAIAADETMAMINRLQEQKAAMQMEAMQYQRLMEEQSEYDQEALQRLNDLVVKRDKERQDMERELELYRHKIHLYETKERRKMSRHKADDQNGSSSASSSAEDSDDLSQSFYDGGESTHGLNGSNGSADVLHETASHIVTIDGSLADCEEERLSILQQLKVLEERLFDLEDEEPDSMKMDKLFAEDNHLNGASNGFSDEDISFKLQGSRRGSSYSRKKLLPLFDDATVQNGNGILTKQYTEADPSAEVVLELAKEQDKLAIASEIDQVHERLHALEADKEFIKQCVRSLNKGGKGFVLLQEILQHLRDLRRIEQRARNSGELSPHYVHPYMD